MTDDKPAQSIETIWDELTRAFNNKRGMKPSRTWFTHGFSKRLLQDRIQTLESSLAAKDFRKITENCSAEDLRSLSDIAGINLEQVQATSRFSIIMNFSVYLAALVLINQIFPGKIAAYLNNFVDGSATTADYAILAVFCLAAITSFFLAFFSLAGVNMARDLKNLIELAMIKKRMPITPKTKSSSMQAAPVPSDLKFE